MNISSTVNGMNTIMYNIDKTSSKIARAGTENEKTEVPKVNLTKEIPNLMSYEKMYGANLKVIQTKDEVMGTVLEILK